MSLSLRHEFLSSDEGFSNESYLSTFVPGTCKPCRIHGPANLVRLVDGSRYSPFGPSPGDFWMEEIVFLNFMAAAAADLASQNRQPDPALTGLHARFQLRDGLAVSRDWSNLDQYIRLVLPAGDSLIALVGPAAGQGYYSSNRPEDRARAGAAGITLPGLTEQIIINFNYPDNEPVRRYVSGPFLF